jgi:MFS family permease
MNAPLRPNVLQRANTVLRPRGHVFYGWWLVLASSGIQLLSGALWMQSYGAYAVLLQREFGWSKTVISGAFAMTRIETGILGPLQGWLTDRFGPRLMLTLGTIGLGIGFMLFSLVDSVLTFYLVFAFMAVAASFGGFPTLMVAIVNWFDRHRAKAVSFSQIGFSLGGLAVPLVIAALTLFGWRTTAFASGVLIIIIGLPLAQLIRHKPETYGETPDGIPCDTDANGSSDGAEIFSRYNFTAREAVRTPAFWLISFGHACALLTVSAVMVHLVPHLIEGLGYSLAAAGGVVALMTAVQMVGQIGGGYLGDLVNKRVLCAACMIFHAAGLLMLAYAAIPAMVVGFAVLHGVAWGTRGPLMVALRADYFGSASFATISGLSALIVMFGMSGGPIIAGYLADVTGSYKLGFSILAAFSMAGFLCFLMATPPKRPGHRATSDKTPIS